MKHETIADLLLDRAADERPGLRTRERTWSWADVARESAARAALARELRTAGPFHIGVLLENVPEYVFWLGAAALSGATIVGINPTRRGAYLEQEVAHTDCQLIITDEAGRRLLDGLDIGTDRFLLIDDPGYPARIDRHRAPVHRGSVRRPEPVVDLRAGEVTAGTQLLLLFTSGTTGASKAVRCSQGRLARLARANCAKYDITRDDVTYCCMPLFHGNALMALWAPSLAAGACVALAPKFSASGLLGDVRFFGATFFTYVGKAIAYVLDTPQRPDDADNTLTHAFGTEASPDDRAAFLNRFGCRLIEGYGSSESAGMVRLDPAAPATALGRPAHPGVKVIDPRTRRACPPARLDGHGRVLNAEQAVGELVDTDGAGRFEGYYNNPAADAERVHHGVYWTGDLGYVDENGFLYFAGRSGDWIRVDGENISALHTERVLRRHPRIRAAAVFGVPDPRSGDQVMAALEIPEGVTFDDLHLAEFLARQHDLGTKGAPRYVRLSHALPATGSGKLRKKELQLAAWRTGDEVHRWAGRGAPSYDLFTEAAQNALHIEFDNAGRSRFLPRGA